MSDSNTITVTGHRPKPYNSFSKKRITVTFKVASGALGPDAVSDTVTITDARCRVNVINGGQSYGNQMSLRIEGLSLALMNRLSVVIGLPDQTNSSNSMYTASTVQIGAGDNNNMSTVFLGQIAEAFADFNGAPDVAFQVTAYATLSYQIDKIDATSFAGDTSVIQVLQAIADKSGLTVFDHGVSGIFLTNPYAAGDTITQIEKIVSAFGGVFAIDSVAKALHVYPNNATITDVGTVIEVNSNTGLVSYPSYNQSGVSLTTFFNPRFLYYTPFQLTSDYQPAGWVDNQMGQAIGPAMPVNGLWRSYLIQHDISSEMPGGPWFTYITAIRADWTQSTP